MYSGSFPAPARGRRLFPGIASRFFTRQRRAFTLVEMLVVMAVVLLMMVLIAPAFTQMNAARTVSKASYDIAGLLNEARAYAKANDTYTWVGFYEEAYDQTAGTAGNGRVILSVVASNNGTATYDSTAANPPALTSYVPQNLIQVGNLVKIDNLHLTVLASTEVPARATSTPPNLTNPAANTYVLPPYQVGDSTFQTRTAADGTTVTNATTFNYPLYASPPTYTFYKTIQFNPLGDATKIVDTPTLLMEVGMRPTHGSVVDANSNNLAAVQISGIGGLVRIFRQ